MHTTCICVENNYFISAMGPWDQSVCMGDRKVSVSYIVKVYYKVGKRYSQYEGSQHASYSIQVSTHGVLSPQKEFACIL